MEIIKPQSTGTLVKIVRFPLTLLIIEAVLLAVMVSLYSTAVHLTSIDMKGPLYFAGALILAALIVGLWKTYRRWLEGEEDREFTLAGSGRELGLGLAIGFGLFSTAVGIVALLGGFEVAGIRGLGVIWPMLSLAVVSGVFEETLFRGILFRHVETMLGSWAALASTSALFGAAHLMNPDATPFAALAIAIEAGILLGAAYMLTRRLWLAIGIHAAWNFTQGWVFSIPVSGGDAPLGLLITRRVGPDWLIGGEFGLEASVIAMAVATLAGVAMLMRAVKRGEVRPPMWRRKAA
jgi:membrane protease YdiL (CAAX protease family)